LASRAFGLSEGVRDNTERASIVVALFRSVFLPAAVATGVAISFQKVGDSWWPLKLLPNEPDGQTYDVLMGAVHLHPSRMILKHIGIGRKSETGIDAERAMPGS